MDARAFADAPLYGGRDDGKVVVKEVSKKGGVCVMDISCPLPPGGLIDGDPELAVLDAPGACWGDLFMGPVQSVEPSAERQLRGTPEEFWAQPFAANLTVYTMDVYDTRSLTDDEWTAMMTWLYWNGWWVDNAERSWVEVVADDLPARYWCPRADTPDPTDESDSASAARLKVVRWGDDKPDAVSLDHDHSTDCCAAPKAPKLTTGSAVMVCDAERRFPKKKALRAAGLAPVPVKRFCRAVGTCTEAGCRYVHEDTIPKIDRPCGFGAECGASDPTGLKRSQCLYMHPGETWTADLCIHRPSL